MVRVEGKGLSHGLNLHIPIEETDLFKQYEALADEIWNLCVKGLNGLINYRWRQSPLIREGQAEYGASE